MDIISKLKQYQENAQKRSAERRNPPGCAGRDNTGQVYTAREYARAYTGKDYAVQEYDPTEYAGQDYDGCFHENRDIDALIPGEVVSNDEGSVYVIENIYPVSYLYGGFRLGEALGIDSGLLSLLGGEDCESINVSELLFIDAETTGLAGGAGTVAFLVGVGFFSGDYFKVRQYFMRDYDEEPAMLAELDKLFRQYKGFVSFNGKAFDINLLNDRFISNRMRPSFAQMPNIDLLFPSRKVWGLKLESCSLSSLEENILGEPRYNDIPGALIPSVYFQYLEDRDAGEMVRVIEHNRLDIMSMVSLLIKLSFMLMSPGANTDGEYEMFGVGKIFEAQGNVEGLKDCFEACAGSGSYLIKAQAVKRLTRVYKREGSYEKALMHWKSLDEEGAGFEIFHQVEMAKYYEHKAKDIKTALIIVDKALGKCLSAGLTGGRQVEELKKRRERLLRKLQRIAERN